MMLQDEEARAKELMITLEADKRVAEAIPIFTSPDPSHNTSFQLPLHTNTNTIVSGLPQPRATLPSLIPSSSPTKEMGNELGPVYWVTGQMSYIPDNAVPFGYESGSDPAQLYVGKIHYKGEWHIGKVGEHLSGANIPYKGKELSCSARYSVLCGDPSCFAWLLVPEGKPFEENRPGIPQGWALVSGGEKATGASVFVAAVDYNGGRQIGEVLYGRKSASIPFGRAETFISPFYVLMIREEKFSELTNAEHSTV